MCVSSFVWSKKDKYFSFNFPFILIFYWSLKRIETLGYGFIFIAGMFNDAVLGFPIGISSLTYLIICGFAGYLRNITLRPSLTKDWLYFLFTILVANSINYFLLVLFFLGCDSEPKENFKSFDYLPQNTFLVFKVNLLSWWTNTLKEGAMLGMANYFAKQKNLKRT